MHAQREEIKCRDVLLECAVMHGDEAEAALHRIKVADERCFQDEICA